MEDQGRADDTPAVTNKSSSISNQETVGAATKRQLFDQCELSSLWGLVNNRTCITPLILGASSKDRIKLSRAATINRLVVNY